MEGIEPVAATPTSVYTEEGEDDVSYVPFRQVQTVDEDFLTQPMSRYRTRPILWTQPRSIGTPFLEGSPTGKAFLGRRWAGARWAVPPVVGRIRAENLAVSGQSWLVAPGEKWAHFLKTPTFGILEVGKGADFTPTFTPTFGFLGHGPANAGRTQTNPQNARGVRKFSIHPEVKMVKISPCNSFSNKLLGLECPC